MFQIILYLLVNDCTGKLCHVLSLFSNFISVMADPEQQIAGEDPLHGQFTFKDLRESAKPNIEAAIADKIAEIDHLEEEISVIRSISNFHIFNDFFT